MKCPSAGAHAYGGRCEGLLLPPSLKFDKHRGQRSLARSDPVRRSQHRRLVRYRDLGSANRPGRSTPRWPSVISAFRLRFGLEILGTDQDHPSRVSRRVNFAAAMTQHLSRAGLWLAARCDDTRRAALRQREVRRGNCGGRCLAARANDQLAQELSLDLRCPQPPLHLRFNQVFRASC